MVLCYERRAFTVPSVPNLRLTFDAAVRYRDTDLALAAGTAGKLLLPENTTILEIKTDGAMPLWLARALDECAIRPASFSKYATAYRDMCRQRNFQETEVKRYA